MPEEEAGLGEAGIGEEAGAKGPANTLVTGPSVNIESGRNGRVSATLTFQVPEGVSVQSLLREVAKMLRASFAGNIDSGGNPKFAPLKPSTLRQKQLRGYPTSPLIRTRLLRNSLAQSNTGGNVNSITRGTTTLTIGTNVPYAAVHQEGSSKKGIPARPFVVIGQEQEAAIAGLVARFNQSLRMSQNQTDANEREAKAGQSGAAAGRRLPPMEE